LCCLFFEIRILNTHLVFSNSSSFPHSCLVTELVTRLTQGVPLVKEEMRTFPEAPPIFCGVRVTRSLVLSVCLVDRCCYFLMR
jgi:hypothetical protein